MCYSNALPCIVLSRLPIAASSGRSTGARHLDPISSHILQAFASAVILMPPTPLFGGEPSSSEQAPTSAGFSGTTGTDALHACYTLLLWRNNRRIFGWAVIRSVCALCHTRHAGFDVQAALSLPESETWPMHKAAGFAA